MTREPLNVRTAFGSVTLVGDGVCIMDGGTHGRIGHRVRVGPDGKAPGFPLTLELDCASPEEMA